MTTPWCISIRAESRRTLSQVSMLPQALLTSAHRLVPTKRQKSVNFYVIVNNALMPEFATTQNKTLSVIARAYSIFLKSQTQSELTALYNYAKLTGAHFHLATIDAQVPYSMLDPFDTNYMQTIYDLGYTGVVSGALWNDRPVFRRWTAVTDARPSLKASTRASARRYRGLMRRILDVRDESAVIPAVSAISDFGASRTSRVSIDYVCFSDAARLVDTAEMGAYRSCKPRPPNAFNHSCSSERASKCMGLMLLPRWVRPVSDLRVRRLNSPQ